MVQTLKASKALLAHIQKSATESAQNSDKKKLLEDEDDVAAQTPIWLTLTTKRHIADTNKLKPGRVPVPHSFHAEDSTICLIVASPQRAYKDAVDDEAFPAALRKRITRVIDINHLQKKFSQYEAQRKLYAEHDIFLGDERIVTRLPKALGKTFYKSTAKRPIPVAVQGKKPAADGKKAARPKTSEANVNPGTPAYIAEQVEKALSAARYAQKYFVKAIKTILGPSATKAFFATTYDMGIDLHKTFAPIKQTTWTMALAVTELTALVTGAHIDAVQKVQPSDWHTTRADIVETMLDLLDLYTQHPKSTKVGSLYEEQHFFDIKRKVMAEVDTGTKENGADRGRKVSRYLV
ncbi:hypothetical protein BN1723_016649, partial [Verticillium longisporum]